MPLDFRALEDMFGAAVAVDKSKDAAAAAAAGGAKKKEPVSVIDGKRAQNLFILLNSKLNKLSFEEVRRALLELNEQVRVVFVCVLWMCLCVKGMRGAASVIPHHTTHHAALVIISYRVWSVCMLRWASVCIERYLSLYQ